MLTWYDKVAITDMENTAIATQSLGSLARVLGHCCIYERLYGQQVPVLDAYAFLNEALINLYASTLEYLCYLKRHLEYSTGGNIHTY